MFEIGNSLREARLRQDLDFATLEAGTKIRSKYLQALESERFEILPGETYVKGFLRTYAEYLGLDGQLYVDEFNSRFASAEDAIAPASTPPPRRPRHRVGESNFVVVALAAIVAVTILVVVAFGFSDGKPTSDATLIPPTGTTDQTTTQKASPKANQKQAKSVKPKLARLVLTATDGDCWMLVRAGGPQGPQLYQGTLEQGQRLPIKKKRIWLQLGRPDLLTVRLNGHEIANFPTRYGATVLVTPTGIRPA